MSSNFNSSNPLTYSGTDPYVQPYFIPNALRAPTVNDIYIAGWQWQDNSTVPPIIYETTGAGRWFQVGSAGGALNTLTGDVGGAVSPLANNINVQGGAAGGILFTNGGAGQMNAQIQVDGTTITINGSDQLTASGALPVQYFSLQTIGAVTATTPDIPLPNNQVSQVVTNIAYIDSGITVGGGVLLSSAIIEIAGGFTLLNALDELSLNESAALALSDYAYIAGGGASTMAIQVTGVAGFTLNWRIGVTIISTP